LHLIGIALLNYEGKRKALPPISSNLDAAADIPGDTAATAGAAAVPGAGDSPGAGYSRTVMILPEFQENVIFQTLKQTSQKFKLGIFATQRHVR
jgi:hypothetical protein